MPPIADCRYATTGLTVLLLVMLSPVTLTTLTFAADRSDPAGIEFFENRVRPILVKHCYECHSNEAKSSKGGLMLDTRAATRKGGESGPAVVGGEIDESLLIEAVRYESFQMPPDGKLPAEAIANLVKWVEMGAPDPRDGNPAVTQAAEEAKEFWAFQSPQRGAVPQVNDRQWTETAIDRFVLAALERAGLEPVADADRRSLLRRVYFDLTGLPPTPDQIEAFVNDPLPTPRALQRVVDRLLDSDAFGQRWARHWLDVARYAESTGKEWNWAHPHAWRYRDYVIDAFNQDKPYDQFLREQIAGDLLADDDPTNGQQKLIATGFLAIGPKAVSIGNNEEFGLELADEQINTISRGVLGLTVGCARCHDHKFDPISTEDYYALTGIFLSTQTLFGTSASGFKGRNNKQGSPLVPIGPHADEMHQAVVEHQQKIDQQSATLAELQKELDELRDGDEEASDQSTSESEPQQESDDKDAKIVELEDNIKQVEAEIERMSDDAPPKPGYAMAVRDRDDPLDCQIRIGGQRDQLGKAVPRGFLTALSTGSPMLSNRQSSGREELASWLTDPAHPLTARVMVNRIWQHLFGRGLVSTVDNFGWLGARPSHPQLLDHLAVSFTEDGWSVKRLLRRIVLSRVYRLGTDYDADAAEVDPGNVWLWRMSPRRLEAEEIRDAMLAISGRLQREPLPGSPAVARLDVGWIGNEVKEPEFKNYDHHHRSIYLPIVRDQVPEMLQTFDFPNPAEVTGSRDVSIVPAQALYLMNSEFVVTRAREAAGRFLASQQSSGIDPIDRAYRVVLGRQPTTKEHERDAKMLARFDRILQKKGHEPAAARQDAMAALVQSLFASGEFLFLF